ncbi:hypothetical protein ADIARSV_3044 [Arcticibacter svalbardensis MN12-7]|uniref:Uncharacterized protein n=1 Tax=Arcticibacter svalbardensis MN12-7 TaxID=1150600 RepID=R9GQ11_9SPHI|nr:hypothetical protein [Arcticibacter svalbardensis]EOR93801.1 hypothetical protein ADIARSV_3044 [Arcticibacter svalbardensis MN12-7]
MGNIKLKDSLLNGFSFTELLKEYAVDPSDFTIQDEQLILSEKKLLNKETIKEKVIIVGKGKDGLVSFYGTLHYNLLNKLAVFELDSVDQTNSQVA